MSVIRRIHEAVLRHKCQTGNDPTILYLGTQLDRELKQALRDHVLYSAPINPQIYQQCPEFEGMKVLTVLGEPLHLHVR